MTSEWHNAWRIFEVSDKGPKTLFHAHNGSRTLPTGVPLKAKQGIVSNPGGDSKYTFRAGWHVALTPEEAHDYLKRFTGKRELCVCRIRVKDIRPKPRATAPVYLAKHMFIKEEDWKEAINVG